MALHSKQIIFSSPSTLQLKGCHLYAACKRAEGLTNQGYWSIQDKIALQAKNQIGKCICCKCFNMCTYICRNFNCIDCLFVALGFYALIGLKYKFFVFLILVTQFQLQRARSKIVNYSNQLQLLMYEYENGPPIIRLKSFCTYMNNRAQKLHGTWAHSDM